MWFSPVASEFDFNDAYFVQRGAAIITRERPAPVPSRRSTIASDFNTPSYQWGAAALFLVAAALLLIAALADSSWQARDVSDFVGLFGLFTLLMSVCMVGYARYCLKPTIGWRLTMGK